MESSGDSPAVNSNCEAIDLKHLRVGNNARSRKTTLLDKGLITVAPCTKVCSYPANAACAEPLDDGPYHRAAPFPADSAITSAGHPSPFEALEATQATL